MQQAANLPVPAPGASQASGAAARREALLERQKHSFLRMVSHELRTPLNSILGFSDIIAQELCGPVGTAQYRDYAVTIRTSGERLLKLVNQVIEIARLDGHACDLSPKRQDLDHALDDVLDGLADDLRTRGTEVIIADRGALPPLVADDRGLRTVLSNLIHNACVHGPEGGRVEIVVSEATGQVMIAIADDGPGVDPADIPRLLRPFEQGDNALTRRNEGAGLGLPIVNLLCQAMGGRLTLESRPGEGLRAVVRLPRG